MKKNELKIINAVLAMSHAGAGPREALSGLAAELARLTGADRVVIYLSASGQEELVRVAETAAPEAPASPPSISATVSPALLALHPDRTGLFENPGEVVPFWEGYPHAAFVPFGPGRRRGFLAVLARRPEKLRALGASFFAVLRDTVQLELEELLLTATVKKQVDEMRLLHEIGQATYATLDLDQLLPLVARLMAETLDCDACHILLSPRTGHKQDRAVTFSWPQAPAGECLSPRLAEINRRLMQSKALELDIPLPPCPPEGGPQPAWHSGFPLACQQEIVGSVILLHRRPLTAGEDLLVEGDRSSFMESLADEVSLAVANALNFVEAGRLAAEHESRVRELSVLHEVSQALAGTMKLDDLLKMILTAATYGHGLGFNRAVLFLMNEKTRTLQGMMGVGPDSHQEAARVWSELAGRGWDLAQALAMSVHTPDHTTLDAAVKTVRLQVTPESGILARCALERQAINVPDINLEPRVNRPVAEKLGSHAFAAAPLIAGGDVLGVLAVDNLYNGRPITDADVRLLSTFASKAAMAIRNAQLYSRLERANQELKSMYRRLGQSERLAALGELAATVAHEVRNPLVSVGGFARRLERRLDPEDPNRRYTGIILKELSRLEKFLSEILIFSRDLPLTLSQVDLNRIVGEMADFFRDELEAKHIALSLDLDDGLPFIEADSDQLSRILINFFTNSIDALAKGGTITIRTRPAAGAPFVELTFADTGGGIPEHLVANVFHPFFTTKSRGTGLGLPLIHKMVKNHHGSIEILNKPGESLAFTVRLPLTIVKDRPPAAPKEGQA